ncbi:hypothetical protein Tco_0738184 [Tanacetum coccineum]
MTTSSDIGSREDSGGLFATPPVVIHESQHDTSTTSTDTKIDSSSLPSTHVALPRPGGRGLASSPNSSSWPTPSTCSPSVRSTGSTGEGASHFAWDLKISYFAWDLDWLST